MRDFGECTIDFRTTYSFRYPPDVQQTTSKNCARQNAQFDLTVNGKNYDYLLPRVDAQNTATLKSLEFNDGELLLFLFIYVK